MIAHEPQAGLVRRHLRIGWWSLAVFASMGLALEGLHGFKVRWYLDATNETRRLMWTLAHAHGTALGLVHIAFAATVALRAAAVTRAMRVASACLLGASVALPGGFLLGGAVTYGGDPGVGVLLVPVGGLLLVVALVLLAAAQGRSDSSSRDGRPAPTLAGAPRRARNHASTRDSSR